MTRRFLVLLLLLLSATPMRAAADDDSSNPHLMVLKDGSPDTDKCSFCHNDDLTLARSKEETCTICHTIAQHAGSLEHSKVRPDEVKHLVPVPKPGEVALPLTDSGGIYCGTCHLPHDPNGIITSEPWLKEGCPESTTAFATAVRTSVEEYRDKIADKQAAHFVKVGTRALRMPVCDGALCVHCHGDHR